MSRLTEKLDGVAEMIRPMYPEAADWVEVAAVELRRGDNCVKVSPEVAEQASDAVRLQNELDQLRAQLSDAPHGRDCFGVGVIFTDQEAMDRMCTCWKSDIR